MLFCLYLTPPYNTANGTPQPDRKMETATCRRPLTFLVCRKLHVCMYVCMY